MRRHGCGRRSQHFSRGEVAEFAEGDALAAKGVSDAEGVELFMRGFGFLKLFDEEGPS